MKSINVVTLFSGYDSQCLALNRLGVPYELVGWSEIDRYAIRAHNALFPQWENRNLGDVAKVDWGEFRKMIDEPIDLLTYSSPCQDFSAAGLGRGGEEGSGTRSGLLWESQRAIEALHPRWLLFENVPNLLSKKHRHVFDAWCARLETLGYRNHWQKLNAKHYGVPQNRNRVFMVSVLGGGEPYFFPDSFPLERRLKDVLEREVDESFYLSEERVRGLLASTVKESARGNGFGFFPKDPDSCEVSSAVLATTGSRKTDNFIKEVAMLSQARTEEMKEERRRHPGDRGMKWGRKEMRPRSDGLCNTLTSNESKDNLLMESVTVERTVLGWSRDDYGNIVNRHPVEVANCVTCGKRENTQNYVQEYRIAAVRGRSEGEWHESEHTQRLEVGGGETSNALSSVGKDNLLMEQVLLNGDSEGNASTITTGHDRARNITEPKGGHKQMGVLEMYSGSCGQVLLNGCADGTAAAIRSEGQRAGDGCITDPKGGHGKMGVLEYSMPGNDLSASCVIRIRRLTPRELFRLMDVDESDIDTLLSAGIPKTQLSKLAGNSIVVNVLYHILRRLLVDTEAKGDEQLKLF